MHRLRSFFKDWLKALLISLVLLVSFVWFVGNWFVVTSSSMENSLYTGDFVFVSKYTYGARMPFTPLSIPFSHRYSKLIMPAYLRLPGFGKVERNDIVAFNYPDLDTTKPIDQKSVWIKRVVGLPGDTIRFENARVYLNNAPTDLTGKLKFNYHLQLSGDEGAFFYKYNINDASRISSQNDWLIQITEENAREMRNYKGVTYLLPQNMKMHDFEEEVYPYELEYGWNEDFYGPVEIPSKGKTIRLSLENIPLYRLCIKAYEGNDLVEFGDKFFLNGKPIKEYTFKYDYYFVAGDNRHKSSDSRYWGFLPETHLVGKVSTVFFSIDKSAKSAWNRIRWNRTFKSAE